MLLMLRRSPRWFSLHDAMWGEPPGGAQARGIPARRSTAQKLEDSLVCLVLLFPFHIGLFTRRVEHEGPFSNVHQDVARARTRDVTPTGGTSPPPVHCVRIWWRTDPFELGEPGSPKADRRCLDRHGRVEPAGDATAAVYHCHSRAVDRIYAGSGTRTSTHHRRNA